MGRKILVFVCLLVVLGLAALTILRYREAKTKEEGRKVKKEKEALAVNMVLPERCTMRDERRFSGTAIAWSDYDISPKVSGRLVKLNCDIGDMVKRGTLIAKIDDTEYVQQERQAAANLDFAMAKQKEAEGLAATRRNEFERQKRLRESNATSESVYEQAESDMVSAEAALDMCKAEVKRCQALLDNAKLKLSDTEITADWTEGGDVRYIGTRYVDEGTLLSVGTQIVSIVELNRVKAYIQIIERDYPLLHEGQKAEITTDAYPGAVFEGTITNIGNTLSDKTRSALAVITIENSDLRLRPGMFLRAKVVLGVHENTCTLPLIAVVQRDDAQAVFRYENGKAVLTPVKTGLIDGERVEILSPEIRTPVVTVGNHLLKDGREVVMSELSRVEMAEQQRKRHEPEKGTEPEKKP